MERKHPGKLTTEPVNKTAPTPDALPAMVAKPLVTLTNPAKVLYPETGTTKQDVFNYYFEIAPYLLPHLICRPVTRRVWPNGVTGTTFFAKESGRGTPDWINKVPIQHKSGTKDYVLLDSQAALAWDAQQAGLEIHVPQWRFAAQPDSVKPILPPEQLPPDRMVIDLDPGEGATLAQCAQLALKVRDLLAGMGLASFPVTSGSKGIHIYAPLPKDGINGKPLSSDDVSKVAKGLAQHLEKDNPDQVISTMSKASRVGKVMVDWSQNNGKKTTITPYSLRGQQMPYVAAPRTWAEIAAPGLTQLTYQEVLERVRKNGDLLAGLLDGGQAGKGALKKAKATVGKDKTKAVGVGEIAGQVGNDDKADGGIAPMLASMPSQDELRHLEAEGNKENPDWGFEIKWDGYRAIAVITKDTDGHPKATFWSRNGQNYTDTYPQLADLANQVTGDFPIVLDGEIVALDAKGKPSFPLLQQHQQRPAPQLTFQCFDVLAIGGKDITKLPFYDRREKLAAILHPEPPIFISPLLPYQDAMDISTAYKLEGVMAKRLDAPYQPGIRSKDWLKIKHLQTKEVVIVGYKMYHAGEPNESATAIGSLLLAVRDDADLRCVGRVGTGFTEAMRKAIFAKLNPLTISKQPKEVTGVTKAEAKFMQWVKPELKGHVEFAEWTTEPNDPKARLRHPRWRGWA